MMTSLLIVCLLTVLIHAAETLSYAVRFAGVRMGKLAVALSLTGVIVLVARTANLAQAPLTGKMVDQALKDPGFDLETVLRLIIAASTLGTLIAITLFPSFVRLFSRAVVHLEAAGSIPKLVSSVTVDRLRSARTHFRKPTWSMLRSLRLYGIPKRFLLLNMAVTAIYTIGVLSTLYASYMDPDHLVAISQSSGLINGMATILLTLFIDPQVAIHTDRALADPKEKPKLGRMFGLMMFSRLCGTMLAQAIFWPAAWWVGALARWLLV